MADKKINNAVFIHIPKTAGRYILEALALRRLRSPRHTKDFDQKGMVSFGHQNYARLIKRGRVSKEFDRSSFKFAFCRNPFDRVVSHYFYARRWHPDLLPPETSFLEYTRRFDEYIMPKRWHYRIYGKKAFMPQFNFIRGVKIDFIGRFENLEKDVQTVADKLGLEVRTNKVIGAEQHEHYASYYNEESEDNVRKYYKIDFEKFGYDNRLLHIL